MPQLNNTNCRVDKGSGAIIFNGSPELQELVKLRNQLNTLDKKMDYIISLLMGGEYSGGKMENK